MLKPSLTFLSVILVTGCVYMPKPISLFEADQQSKAEYRRLEGRFKSIEDLDLYAAIAYGLKHNSNQRISQLELVLTERDQLLNGFEILPELSANAGYKTLNELNPSTSTSYDPETGTFAPIVLNNTAYSVSQDLKTATGSAGLTWNALDFGLSYIRAAQGADQLLIAKELQRKATHNLVREIINTYYKAYAADIHLDKISNLKLRAQTALKDSEYIEELGISSPIEALFYQKELLDILQVLSDQERALINAKVELSVLLGIPMSKKINLVKTTKPLTEINLDLESMEELTLNLRPELMESRYNSRIAAKEVRASIVSAMPSLSLARNWSYSDSSFLFEESSYDYGANIGFNFISMFSAPTRVKNAKSSKSIEDEKRMALYMTVLSQLHIALNDYAQNYQDFSMSRHYEDVAHRIYFQTLQGEQAASFGEIETIREEVSLMVASLKKESAFANLQYGIAKVLTSIGIDLVPYNFQDLSEQELAFWVETNLFKIMKNFEAIIKTPINMQNPLMQVQMAEYSTDETLDYIVYSFQISPETFELTGPGEVRYKLQLTNGDSVPRWLSFNPSTLEIIASPNSDNIKSIELQLVAENDVMSVADTFKLLFEQINSNPEILRPKQVSDAPWDTVVPVDSEMVQKIIDKSSADNINDKIQDEINFADTPTDLNSRPAEQSKPSLDILSSNMLSIGGDNSQIFSKEYNVFGIQLGAFVNSLNAQKLATSLADKNFLVFKQPNLAIPDLTSVNVGPIFDESEMPSIMNKLKAQFALEGKVVSWRKNNFKLFAYRVGVFTDENNVSKLEQALSNQGFPAFAKPNESNKTLTTVMVGPFVSIDDIRTNQTVLNKIAGITMGEIITLNP